MAENSSLNRSGASGSSQDKYAPGTVDVSDPSGKKLDLGDEVLDAAKGAVDMASKGAIPKVRHQLPQRIAEGDFIEVQDDPGNLPVDTELNIDDDNIFLDDDTYQDDNPIDYESSNTDTHPQVCGPSRQPQRDIDDPMVWIIESLKTIHADLQIMKPSVEMIVPLEKKVHELQLIMGPIAGSIRDMGNKIANMEKTLTTQRSDINKLTDIVISYMNLPSEPKVTPQPPMLPKVATTAELNITKMVEVISQKKNLTGDQEVILRNLISNKDRDIIITSLKDLGIMRPLMSAELDLILQVDYGSSKGMNDVMKLLNGLIPERIRGGCPPDCTMTSEISAASRSLGRRANPFRLN